MPEDPTVNGDDAEIGDDNTVLGPVPRRLGSRNTLVRDADARGNVTHTGDGEAIGYGARAGRGSVAIGSGALAGDVPQLAELLTQLSAVFAEMGDVGAETIVAAVDAECRGGRDEGRIAKLWETVKAAATTNEAISLVTRITPLLLSGPHH